MKVLVIDDSNTIRSAGNFPQAGGTTSSWRKTASTPWRRSTTARPTSFFCDILMPRLDGYQTCAIIKHDKSSQTLRS